MSLVKRGNIWWIDFTTPNGQRIRRSTETENKTQAQELHDKLKGEMWRISKLGEKPRHSWNEAVVRWGKETSHRTTAWEDAGKLRWLDKFLNGKQLEDINRSLIERIIEAKLSSGCSNATVNRNLALIRAILRKAAREWEWLDKPPAIRMLKEQKLRVRYLTREQAARLLAELPEHLAAMAEFTLATGLRAANVTKLQWDQIDLERRLAWVHPDQAKARKAIPVPLNEDAMAILEKQLGKCKEWVFTYKSHPILQPSTRAWRKALKRAEIEDFCWHSLRHTWASWHIQGGTPLYVLQEMGGWASSEMVRRYAHLSADHLAPYAAKLNGANTAQCNIE
jgi:integrase